MNGAPSSSSSRGTLSIVIPVYNEHRYIREVVERVREAPLPAGVQRQVILVDDGSTDGTTEILQSLAQELNDVKVIYQSSNQGKGAALRAGLANADGDFVIIQDADFEYDPRDYPKLLKPLLAGRVDVVYGSRFTDRTTHAGWHRTVNRFLTGLSNLTTGQRLTDMECCYKLFRRSVLSTFEIEEDRFGVEPEITAKLAHQHIRIEEVPCSYAGRSYEQGKKIGWKDGISALRCIVTYGMLQGRVRRRDLLLVTLLTVTTLLAVQVCVRVERLNAEGPFLPRSKYAATDPRSAWEIDPRAYDEQLAAASVLEGGPIGEDVGKKLTRDETKAVRKIMRRAEAKNQLRQLLVRWSLWQHLFVFTGIYLAVMCIVHGPLGVVRLFGGICALILLGCGIMMIYRQYLVSLGW